MLSLNVVLKTKVTQFRMLARHNEVKGGGSHLQINKNKSTGLKKKARQKKEI